MECHKGLFHVAHGPSFQLKVARLCDRICDSVRDAILQQDSNATMQLEACAKLGMVTRHGCVTTPKINR